MASPEPFQCILPNPDIAGIGVRVSIYVQSLLTLLHPLLVGWDGKLLRVHNIESLQGVYIGVLLTALALLASAFIQAGAFSLSIYHALIVLNLGWINNANASVFSLFLVATWIMGEEQFLEEYEEDGSVQAESEEDGSEMDFEPGCCSCQCTPMYPTPKTPAHRIYRSKCKRALLVVGGMTAFHLTLTAIFGLWLWFNTASSTFQGEDPACVNQITYAIFNHDIPVTNVTLKRVSLAVYFMMLVPILNLWVFWTIVQPALIPVIAVVGMTWMLFHAIEPPRFLPSSFRAWLRRRGGGALDNLGMGGAYIISLLASLAMQLYFIICTERMIKRNAPILLGGDEKQWTFGQTLAIGVIALPLLEIVKSFRSEKRAHRLRKEGDEMRREAFELTDSIALGSSEHKPLNGIARKRTIA